MTDELDEILISMAGAVRKETLALGTADPSYEVQPIFNPAKQAIQALIAKECNKARINELEKVEIYDDSDMTQEYLLKRITALKEGLKG